MSEAFLGPLKNFFGALMCHIGVVPQLPQHLDILVDSSTPANKISTSSRLFLSFFVPSAILTVMSLFLFFWSLTLPVRGSLDCFLIIPRLQFAWWRAPDEAFPFAHTFVFTSFVNYFNYLLPTFNINNQVKWHRFLSFLLKGPLNTSLIIRNWFHVAFNNVCSPT